MDVGLQKAEVLTRCGQPTSQSTRSERRLVRQRGGLPGQPIVFEREVFITVDEWVYNFGPTQFMQLLAFEDGRLVRIQDLGYGR